METRSRTEEGIFEPDPIDETPFDEVDITISDQLIKKQFPKNIFESDFRIGLISSPLSAINNILSQLESSNPISDLFYIYKNGVDINRTSISSLNLICYELDTYFHTVVFNNNERNTLTTFSGRPHAKKVVEFCAGMIIFSDDADEIVKVCDEIEILCGKKNNPYLFAATKLDKEDLDERITNVIDYRAFNSHGNSYNFWAEVKKHLDYQQKQALKANPKEKKFCLMM